MDSQYVSLLSELERKVDFFFLFYHLCPKHVFPVILGFTLSLKLLSVPCGFFSAMCLTSHASPTQIRTTFFLLFPIFLL